MRSVAFEKWEGLGNDFILLPADAAPDAASQERLARALCDRRRGVGADGLLFVDRAGDELRMIVRNADGSRPEMCGNGLRCVAAHLAEVRGMGRLTILTDAGARACEVVGGASGVEVTVDMGVITRGAELVVDIDGERHAFDTADAGNPHAITFRDYDARAIDVVGPRVATTPPGGTNVEFCRASPGRLDVVVWERGVGRTLACGTGACAVALVACATGRARYGAPIVVGLPGGDLVVEIDERTRVARMRGPARRVFRGEVEIS